MPPSTRTPPFFSAFERGRNELSRGRENDGGVEFLRRLDGGFVRPHRAEFQRELLMLFAARARVDFGSPMARHLNGHVRCRTKTVESEPAAAFDAGKAQAAEADDSRAEQRRSLFDRRNDSGNGVDESLGRDGVFSVAAVDRVAGERGMVAEIFAAGAAEFAGASVLCSQARRRARPLRSDAPLAELLDRRRRSGGRESRAICAAATRLRSRADPYGTRRKY